MPKPLDIVTEIIGDDEQTRTQYAITDFLVLEAGTRLRQVYEYWARLPRNERGLPDESSCYQDETSQNVSSLLGSWVETRSEDPLEFIMREHEPNAFPGYGVELSGKPFCDYPDSLHGFSCAAEYLFCKTDREPVYHQIRQTTGGIKRHYARILLPLDGEAGTVSRIYYAVRRIEPSRRVFNPRVLAEES